MILVIVNPVAGKLRAKSALFEIIDVFNAAGHDVNVRISQHRGHARALARDARRAQYERIVCVGGDGTLNEVITGVIESGEGIPLGYIPLGSTNDFASTLKLSRDVTIAARAAIEGAPVSIDVGQFDDERIFAYIASFGVFSAASYTAPQSTKNALGHFAYILEGIKDIVNIKAYHMVVEADGVRCEDDYIFAAVVNSTSIAGIFKLDSEIVDLSDGLFEVVLIKTIRSPNDLNLVIGSIMNSDFNNKMFDFIRAPQVKFTMDQELH
ncbi:MAG: diacylglycerol/lipid kinase family protein, partial [Christensenellales bacterium]